MCFAVYLATDKIQNVSDFIDGQTSLYISDISQEGEVKGLKEKFTKSHIYYVGSYQGCSCGFAYDPLDPKERDEDDDPIEENNVLKSVTALIALITQWTEKEDVQFYCCWEGDWELPIEYKEIIDITTIKLGDNYFGLVEKRFITFKQPI